MGYLFHALVEASSVIFTYQLSIFRIDNRKINFKSSIQKLYTVDIQQIISFNADFNRL